MNYTDRQKEAINCISQNLQIIACAGSGKTQVISARIVNILKTKKIQGITPANIVAFTFTDKAAGELKDRIHRLCKEELGSDLGLAEMFVGTIHAYCLNLLQAPPLYKFLKYTVLTDVQQRLLIDRNSTKSGLTQVPLLSGGKLERWKDSRLYQQLLGIYGEGNVTRFVLVMREDERPSGRDRTSIAFTLDRDRPGGLYEVIGEFARRGINLSKIESRPNKQAMGHYIFFLDFEGHRIDPGGAEALAGVLERVHTLSLLGSYPRAG